MGLLLLARVFSTFLWLQYRHYRLPLSLLAKRSNYQNVFEKGLSPVEVAPITGQKETRVLMRFKLLRAVDLVERLG